MTALYSPRIVLTPVGFPLIILVSFYSLYLFFPGNYAEYSIIAPLLLSILFILLSPNRFFGLCFFGLALFSSINQQTQIKTVGENIVAIKSLTGTVLKVEDSRLILASNTGWLNKKKVSIPTLYYSIEGWREFFPGNNIFIEFAEIDIKILEIIGGSSLIFDAESYPYFSRSKAYFNLEYRADYYMSSESSAIFKSVLMADKRDLDGYFLNMLKELNIYHLFAISGTHVAILYFFFWILLRCLCLPLTLFDRSGKLTPWIHFWVIGGIWLYLDFIGYPVSAVRSFLWILGISTYSYFFSEHPWWSKLATVAVLMLIVDPLIICSRSFQLSFLAVGVILALLEIKGKAELGESWLKSLSRWFIFFFSVNVSLMLFLLPIIAEFNGRLDLFSPFNNILHVNYMTWLVLPISILMIISGLTIFQTMNPNFVESIMWEILDLIAAGWIFLVEVNHKITNWAIMDISFPDSLVIRALYWGALSGIILWLIRYQRLSRKRRKAS